MLERDLAACAPSYWTTRLRNARAAARALIGCVLVREQDGAVLTARIVETEAYLPDDPASHSFAGVTARNRTMFERAGLAYVYRIHRSYCLNVVTGPRGRGEAVLIRAVEPVGGIEAMEALRARGTVGRRLPRGRELTSGPGRLCQALDVTLDLDGHDLLASDSLLRLLPRARRPAIAVSSRIGISKARDWPLRFYVAESPWVSR